MTETYPYALPLLSVPRAHSKTITTLRETLLNRRPGNPAPRPGRSDTYALIQPDEHASDRILAGLTLLTIPAIIYSLAQLLSLISSGSLDQAVRAFLS